jgi:hypothetical protein
LSVEHASFETQRDEQPRIIKLRRIIPFLSLFEESASEKSRIIRGRWNLLLMLYYFNWTGTSGELRKFVEHMKSIIKGTESAEFTGLFIPTSEWNYVIVMKAKSYEKILQIMKTYIEKFGWAKTSLAKAELLHTFEDLGLKE